MKSLANLHFYRTDRSGIFRPGEHPQTRDALRSAGLVIPYRWDDEWGPIQDRGFAWLEQRQDAWFVQPTIWPNEPDTTLAILSMDGRTGCHNLSARLWIRRADLPKVVAATDRGGDAPGQCFRNSFIAVLLHRGETVEVSPHLKAVYRISSQGIIPVCPEKKDWDDPDLWVAPERGDWISRS